MTPEFRQVLRYMIDRAQRELRQSEIEAGRLKTCAGCGADHGSNTDGCATCNNRTNASRPHALERKRNWYHNIGAQRRRERYARDKSDAEVSKLRIDVRPRQQGAEVQEMRDPGRSPGGRFKSNPQVEGREGASQAQSVN